MRFSSVLVANRGEIALRIMRTVRAQGMRCIAVYSDADVDAPHVRYADDAVCVGPSPVAQSYLAADRLLRAAQSAGADAVHPGYGLLSENAAFARAVADAGLTFIGPPAAAIEVMGDKAASKRAMLAAGVPCVPGYHGHDQSDERLQAEAAAIGYPLMVKAAAGGGGRGIRLVTDAALLPQALRLAASEAHNAFGSAELILEKAVQCPRHVEMQVFADAHGNTIHLGERDCSVQRRHQKIIEESPCPVMTAQLREQMGAAAVAAARAVDYVGAGTVEFLLDDAGQFYFLEMNTRLQVEHPVTELVTGLDLVAMQLDVAQGRPLRLQQADVVLQGAAIEARLYAEDPARDFLPSTGRIGLWRPPSGAGIRVDAGIETGSEVSPYYDSMVAKLIAWGETRAQARQRLLRALEDTVLLGPVTNRDFLRQVVQHPVFAAGEATTALLGDAWPEGAPAFTANARDLAGAAVIRYALAAQAALCQAVGVPSELRDWCSAGTLVSTLRFVACGADITRTVEACGSNRYRVYDGDTRHDVTLHTLTDDQCRLGIDGRDWVAHLYAAADDSRHLSVAGSGQFSIEAAGRQTGDGRDGDGGPQVLAPMHALVLRIDVAEGDCVARGDALVTLEAMKMQHVITAPVAGTVQAVTVTAGTQVAAGALLLEILAC